MEIKKYYKYKKDGFVYTGSSTPDGAELIETMDVLFAEKGYALIRIKDNEYMGNSVWLKSGDSIDDYEEVADADSK